jgi:alpha-L-rhamnosidase
MYNSNKMKKKSILLYALLLVVIASAVMLKARTIYLPEAITSDWSAQWIWLDEDGPENSWVAFRREVSWWWLPKKATARIAADTKYWLWINGELVVFEGGLVGRPSQNRPWDRQPQIWNLDSEHKPSNTWYQEVDIKPYLKRGKNTIAALVWHWDRETHKGVHIASGKGGFLFQAELGRQQLISDSSWKVKLHPAYSQEHIDIGRNLVAYPVVFDARENMDDWTSRAWQNKGYDDSGWENAVEKGIPPVAPWHELELNRVPLLTNHGLQNYNNYPSSDFPFIADGKEIHTILPFNKQVNPFLEIEAEEGLEILITTDNRHNRITAKYTTRKGRQSFETYSWMNGHKIIYHIPEGVKVHALKYRWMSVGEMAGSFECDDPFLNRLWEMGRNTLFVCARDNFMDCPDRERALWIGDVADQASYLFHTMDHAGRELLRQSIYTTLNFRDGKVFGSLGPLRVRELPSQSLQFISQVIWEYYLNTADIETLRFAYTPAKAYLTLWRINEVGLPVRNSPGDDSWNWFDWGEENTVDKEVILTSLYFMALTSMREMAIELGETDDLPWYETRMHSIRKAFNEYYWQDEFYSSNPKLFEDDRANALAIISGLADKGQYGQIVQRVLIPNHFCSPHFEWMVNEAMFQAGYKREALNRMIKRYTPQVETPWLTTLYERFPTGGTYNHAWNAPNTILSRRIAGINPRMPGWTEYYVMPDPNHLKKIHQVVPTVKGNIDFKLQRNNENSVIELHSPEGTTAILGIPVCLGQIKSVVVNNRMVYENYTHIRDVRGVSFYGRNDTHLQFMVSPGNWKFEAVHHKVLNNN